MPQQAFAAQELKDAIKETERENLQVSLIIRPDATSQQACHVRSAGPNQITVIGTDANGVMYGGLEVADRLQFGLTIKDQEQAPFIKKRGIKLVPMKHPTNDRDCCRKYFKASPDQLEG